MLRFHVAIQTLGSFIPSVVFLCFVSPLNDDKNREFRELFTLHISNLDTSLM